jgi:hypothetical protein
MTIKYANGTKIEAVIVTRRENTIRVALRGGDDVVEFTDLNGTWVSEDCEPVQIEFAWQRRECQIEYSEDDFICPQELAARLIEMLLPGEEPERESIAPAHALLRAAVTTMVA